MEKLQIDTTKNKCFVYLRRSSKARWQEDSIENQKLNILRYLRDNTNLKEEDLIFFVDDAKSWFKVTFDSPLSKKHKTKREAFLKMLEEIKKLKNPCFLFVFNISRLARNYEDIPEVKKLLWLRVKNNKRLIEEIIFTLEDKSWKYNTSEVQIMNEVWVAVAHSETSSKYTTDNRIRALEKWEFPKTITPPKGTELKNGVLCPTEEMQHIIRAFEMKANKFKDIDIRAYLKRNWIKTSNRIKEVIFSNECYIWFYTLPANKIKYRIKLKNNKPLIPLELFNKINTGNNRGRDYWKLQVLDFISTILKTPCGKNFSAYTPGWKTQKQYLNSQTKSFISSFKLQKEYLANEVFEKFLFFYDKVFFYNLIEFYSKKDNKDYKKIFEFKKIIIDENFLEVQRIKVFLELLNNEKFLKKYNYFKKTEKEKKEFEEKIFNKLWEFTIFWKEEDLEKEAKTLFNYKDYLNLTFEEYKNKIWNKNFRYIYNFVNDFDFSFKEEFLKIDLSDFRINFKEEINLLLFNEDEVTQKDFLDRLEEIKKDVFFKSENIIYNFLMQEFWKHNPLLLEVKIDENEEIERLNKEIEKKENDLKKVKFNATKDWNFWEDYIQEWIKEMEKEILELKENLEKLNIDRLNNNEILRFSEIVSKIIELLIFSDYKDKKRLSEEDFQEFVKLTTLELIFIKGSSLKIELFDVLEQGKNAFGVNE